LERESNRLDRFHKGIKMVDYKKKWNKYKIGEVEWINNRKEHPARKIFIDYVEKDESIQSIIEVGGGELVEATAIKKFREDLEYTAVDISDVFLGYCNSLNKFNCVRGDMCELPFEDKSFDLFFVSSVLEHSPNVAKTISEAARVSDRFVLTLFKWRMISGGLESNYHTKKKYYTTLFNIDAIIDSIESVGGKFECKLMSSPDGDVSDFDEYRKSYSEDKHRNGSYLTLIGEWS